MLYLIKSFKNKVLKSITWVNSKENIDNVIEYEKRYDRQHKIEEFDKTKGITVTGSLDVMFTSDEAIIDLDNANLNGDTIDSMDLSDLFNMFHEEEVEITIKKIKKGSNNE